MTFDEERLMRYFDGELSEGEAKEMERDLAGSKEARALLGDFERVGDEIRAIAEEQGTRASGTVDRVMENLRRADGAAPAQQEPPARGRVLRLVPLVSGVALAAAAAVALLVRSHASQPIALGPVSVAETASVAAPAAPAPLVPTGLAAAEAEADEEEPGASIESVDFGAQNGTIFMVASGPQVTPVVWLVDDSAPSGGRMAPL